MVMFCENFPVKECFIFWGLSHVLKPLSHVGATMRQLDTPALRHMATGPSVPADVRNDVMEPCGLGILYLGLCWGSGPALGLGLGLGLGNPNSYPGPDN